MSRLACCNNVTFNVTSYVTFNVTWLHYIT